MWNARVSSDTILLFVRQSDLVFTADDIATMAEAGLPDRFIRQLLKEAGNRRDGGSYYSYYPRYDPYYYGSPYPRWFYGGHTVLDLHLGGHFGGHHYGSHHYGGRHYGSIGHRGVSTIGHHGGLTRHSIGSHGYSGSHSRSGHVGRGGHSRHGSSGGHRSGGGHSGGHSRGHSGGH